MIRLDAPVSPSIDAMDGEYVRRHTLRWLDHLPPGVSFMGLNASDLARPKVEVTSGAASLGDLEVRTWKVRFHVDAETASRLRVNIYRFPGWTVRVDGKEVELLDVPRARRVLFFDVPPGAHDVSAVFERTPARKLGDGLTLSGLAALGILGVAPRRRRS